MSGGVPDLLAALQRSVDRARDDRRANTNQVRAAIAAQEERYMEPDIHEPACEHGAISRDIEPGTGGTGAYLNTWSCDWCGDTVAVVPAAVDVEYAARLDTGRIVGVGPTKHRHVAESDVDAWRSDGYADAHLVSRPVAPWTPV